MSRLILALTLVALVLIPGVSRSGDALKGEEKTLYDQLKRGEGTLDSEKAKAVLVKQSKFHVDQLRDSDRVNRDVLAAVVEATIQDLQGCIQRTPPREDVKQEQLNFNRAMGHTMVTELTPLVKHPKLVVRVNAVRMLSVVAQMGCDEVAEQALAVLADPKESEGVKFFALHTLKNLFKYVPEPNVPWKSVFQKDKAEFERKAIVALCDYVLRTHDTTGKSPEEINAIHYNRREAVDALGYVRTHRLRFQGAVLAKPGWVLLKVANCDGISPTPLPLERSMAIYSFTQLFPVTRANVDREIDLDFAADRIGALLLEMITMKANPPPGSGPAIASVPWAVYANKWEQGLDMWKANVKQSNLNGNAAVAALQEHAKPDLLDQLKTSGGPPPDVNTFQQWFAANRAKTTQLYTDDPQSSVKAIK